MATDVPVVEVELHAKRHVYEFLTFSPEQSEYINWNRIGEKGSSLWANVDVRRQSDGTTTIAFWAIK